MEASSPSTDVIAPSPLDQFSEPGTTSPSADRGGEYGDLSVPYPARTTGLPRVAIVSAGDVSSEGPGRPTPPGQG
jgi:hypothetical protein